MNTSLNELIDQCSGSVSGIGVDLVSVGRIHALIDRHGQKFLDRTYTCSEQSHCQGFDNVVERFAGRWAAKEAVAKALGTGMTQGVNWKDIEIVSCNDGSPRAFLRGFSLQMLDEMGGEKVLVSISHCSGFSIAFAVVDTHS